jgi:GAF domain-containing protein
MSASPDETQLSLSDALVALNAIRLQEDPFAETVELIARVSQQTVVPQGEASITLIQDGKAWTVAFTGQLALSLDERQYERGHGPCLAAAESGHNCLISDWSTESRWPHFARQALEQGCRSSLSMPLPMQAGHTGALNLYSRVLDGFDGESIEIAETIAGYAATPLHNAQLHHATATLARQMQEAMKSRSVIDMAKGILIERHKITTDEAFALLVRASQHQNAKLRDVADWLVTTGSLTGR